MRVRFIVNPVASLPVTDAHVVAFLAVAITTGVAA
jgi:hypothetical protein